MRQSFAACLFSLLLIGAACVKTEEPSGVDSANVNGGSGGRQAASGGRTGSGTGGSAGGGSTGSSAGTGGAGSGSVAGSGGSSVSPAAGGTGGSSTGGTTGTVDAPIDSPIATDTAPATPDTAKPADATSDGKYWIKTCPAGGSKADCCAFWCECMKTNCAEEEPMNCVNACMGFTNLPCRTYQCFESLNPNFVKDKKSHCGHAIGRGGFGGNCPK